MSGGFSFSSLKQSALHPERTAKDYAAKKAEKSLFGSLSSMNQVSSLGSMNLFGSKGKKGANPMGQLGQLDTASKKGPALPSIVFQVIALITMSGMIGTFFIYINKREKSFNYDSVEKGIIVGALLIMGLALAYGLKFSLLDFLISSEINIISTYLLVSYLVLEVGTGSSPFENFKTFFKDLWDSIKDPSSVFRKTNLLMTLVFMIIPLLVLINDATQNIFLALTVLLVSAGSVYVLYPKNNAIPIGV
jgi:hypothetical protein